MEEIENWWTQKIDVRELRRFACGIINDTTDEVQVKAAKDLLLVLKGKRGKVNYVEAGGWNSDNHTQALLTHAGAAIINNDRSLFTRVMWYK